MDATGRLFGRRIRQPFWSIEALWPDPDLFLTRSEECRQTKGVRPCDLTPCHMVGAAGFELATLCYQSSYY